MIGALHGLIRSVFRSDCGSSCSLPAELRGVRNSVSFCKVNGNESDGHKLSAFPLHRHQREVGTGYFDKISTTVSATSSTTAMKESTEAHQF